MSFLQSDMNQVLQMCRNMISCVECQQIDEGVLSRRCSHLLCDGCQELHTCSAPSQPVSHQPPSLAFLKGLYQQLTRISSNNQISCSGEKTEEIDMKVRMKRACSGRKSAHQTETEKRGGTSRESSRRDATEEFFVASNSRLRSSKLERKNQVTLEFADLNDLVTRYQASKEGQDGKPLTEMPRLRREPSLDGSLSSDGNPEESKFLNPDTLVAYDHQNQSRSSPTSTDSTDNEEISSISRGLRKQVKGGSRFRKHNKFKQKVKENNVKCKIVSKKRSSSSFQLLNGDGESVVPHEDSVSEDSSLTGPSLSSSANIDSSHPTRPTQHIQFTGFREFEIDYGLIKHLHFKMIVNKSASETGNSGNIEVTIKQRQVLGPETPQPSCSSATRSELREDTAGGDLTPDSDRTLDIRDISPVGREERERTDVSRVFDESTIDMSALSSSTPAPSRLHLHSKRRLSYLQNGRPSQLSLLEEEDHLGTELSPITRKKSKVDSGEDSGALADSENGQPRANGHSQELKDADLLDGSADISIITISDSSQSTKTNGYGEHTQTTPDISLTEDMQTQLDDLIFKEEKENNPEKNDEVVVSFTTCGLSFEQQRLVAKLARLTNSRLRRCFSHETTHLILTEEAIGGHEYLFAIVYRVTIVTFDWVNLCLQQEKILDPCGFIPNLEEGPCRCLAISEKPFRGYYFFMGMSPHPSHLDYDTYQVTKTLCYNGGAHIITDHDGFLPFVQVASVSPRFFICLTSELPETLTECCLKLKAVAIKHRWVLESIRQYRPVPIGDFLYQPLDKSDLDAYRIPYELRRKPISPTTSHF